MNFCENNSMQCRVEGGDTELSTKSVQNVFTQNQVWTFWKEQQEKLERNKDKQRLKIILCLALRIHVFARKTLRPGIKYGG